MRRSERQIAGGNVHPPMSPMIDITFLLLIFFMLNLKILAPEGNFDINLPRQVPGIIDEGVVECDLDLKVGLRADATGNLSELTFGQRNLGNGAAAFDRLSAELAKIARPGSPLTADLQVEIDADYELKYEYIIKAISHCTGRIDLQTGQMVRYIEKIKFAPPRSPKSAV